MIKFTPFDYDMSQFEQSVEHFINEYKTYYQTTGLLGRFRRIWLNWFFPESLQKIILSMQPGQISTDQMLQFCITYTQEIGFFRRLFFYFVSLFSDQNEQCLAAVAVLDEFQLLDANTLSQKIIPDGASLTNILSFKILMNSLDQDVSQRVVFAARKDIKTSEVHKLIMALIERFGINFVSDYGQTPFSVVLMAEFLNGIKDQGLFTDPIKLAQLTQTISTYIGEIQLGDDTSLKPTSDIGFVKRDIRLNAKNVNAFFSVLDKERLLVWLKELHTLENEFPKVNWNALLSLGVNSNIARYSISVGLKKLAAIGLLDGDNGALLCRYIHATLALNGNVFRSDNFNTRITVALRRMYLALKKTSNDDSLFNQCMHFILSSKERLNDSLNNFTLMTFLAEKGRIDNERKWVNFPLFQLSGLSIIRVLKLMEAFSAKKLLTEKVLDQILNDKNVFNRLPALQVLVEFNELNESSLAHVLNMDNAVVVDYGLFLKWLSPGISVNTLQKIEQYKEILLSPSMTELWKALDCRAFKMSHYEAMFRYCEEGKGQNTEAIQEKIKSIFTFPNVSSVASVHQSIFATQPSKKPKDTSVAEVIPHL